MMFLAIKCQYWKELQIYLTLKFEYIIHNFSTHWDQNSLKMTTTTSPLKYTICLTVVLFCRWIQICNRSDSTWTYFYKDIHSHWLCCRFYTTNPYRKLYENRDDVTISQFSCYCIFSILFSFENYILNLINHTCKYL